MQLDDKADAVDDEVADDDDDDDDVVIVWKNVPGMMTPSPGTYSEAEQLQIIQ